MVAIGESMARRAKVCGPEIAEDRRVSEGWQVESEGATNYPAEYAG